MRNKKEKKHRGRTKIRGSLNCFKGTTLEKKAIALHRGPLIEDDLIELRNIAKDAFGLRMKMASRMAGIISPISDESLNIVLDYLKSISDSPNTFRFADCFLAAYNENGHDFVMNSPKNTTNNKLKAFKCGKKDCLKAFNAYFTPIISRMSTDMIELLCNNNLVGKYKDIKVSLAFSIDYICELYCGKMPLELSIHVFNMAKKFDPILERYYNYDEESDCFVLDRSKNTRYSVISQECASYLICYKHK